MNHLDQIETERMVGIRVAMDLWNDWVTLESEPKFLEILETPYDEAKSLERLRHNVDLWSEHGHGQWLFFQKETKAIVGRSGIRYMQVNQVWEYELGYWILPPYWRKGFGFEMAHKSLEIAKSLGIESVVAFALTENVKSIGLMQKLGFQYETEITHADRPHVLYRKQLK